MTTTKRGTGAIELVPGEVDEGDGRSSPQEARRREEDTAR